MKKQASRVVLGHRAGGGTKITLDLDRLVESRLLLQANSGGGKSWALRRLLEQTHGRILQIVIDVEDEFHTLREWHDYILAGRHGGDCPADLKSAPLLARRLLELGVSAIVGMGEIKAKERRRFVRLFLESLMSAPRELWRPALVVVDEAHLFAPEKGQSESADAVIDLMTRGRKRGFCGVLATQRLSKLSKDAAAEANNKLLGRCGLDLDVNRASDELGLATKADKRRLPRLQPGHFFAFGPALADEVVEVQVGPVKTTHPKAGQRAMTPSPPTARVRKILGQLADLPQEAEEEAQSVADLRRRVAELQKELRAAQAAQQRVQVEVPVEVPVVTPDLAKWFERAIEGTQAQLDSLQKAVDELSAALGGARKAAGPAAGGNGARRAAAAPPPRPVARPTQAPAPRRDANLPPARQRILDQLGFLESCGIQQADRKQLALLADQSPKSSGYANNLGALRSAGLIDYPTRGAVALTDEGRELADRPVITSTGAMQEALADRLPPARWRILEALIGTYPAALDRTELAEAVEQSPTSSGFANNLGALRSLGLIDYPDRGQVVACPVLFLEGE